MTRLEELNARFQEASAANDIDRMTQLLGAILTELSYMRNVPRVYYYVPWGGYASYRPRRRSHRGARPRPGGRRAGRTGGGGGRRGGTR